MTKNESVLGMPRDITPQSLHSFETKYGRTPDILQLAFPDLSGNKKGYFAPKEPTTHCGQHIEADFFEAEFNDIPYTDTPEPPRLPLLTQRKSKSYLHSEVLQPDIYTLTSVHSAGYVNSIILFTSEPLSKLRRTAATFPQCLLPTKVSSANSYSASLFLLSRNFSANTHLQLHHNAEKPITITMALLISSMLFAKSKNSSDLQSYNTFSAIQTSPVFTSLVSSVFAYGVNSSIWQS